jgi:hypothetical protein
MPLKSPPVPLRRPKARLTHFLHTRLDKSADDFYRCRRLFGGLFSKGVLAMHRIYVALAIGVLLLGLVGCKSQNGAPGLDFNAQGDSGTNLWKPTKGEQ